MALQLENRRAVTLVAGVSGSGKSTFALRYLVNAPVDYRFAFDADGEFAHRLRVTPARTGGDLDTALCRGWVVFDPHTLFPGRIEQGFAFFCDWCYSVSARLPGRKVMVVDEVWRYCNPYAIPAELATVVQTGRKAGLGLMVNTQRPQKLNGAILNEVSEVVSFRVQFERSLDVLADYGLDRAELAELPALSYVARNCDSGGELRGAIRI